MNYDSSAVGVPYVRAPRIEIDYPPPGAGSPYAAIKQSEAVKLADGSARELGKLPTLEATFNIADQSPIPLVDSETGAPLSPQVCAALGQLVASGNVNLPLVMLCLLAVVRREQLAQEV